MLSGYSRLSRLLISRSNIKKEPALALVNATRKLFLHFQNRETPLSVHREKFDSLVVVIEGFGVSIGEHPKLINEELNLLEDNEREDEIVVKAATLVARDRVLGMIFLTSGGRN